MVRGELMYAAIYKQREDGMADAFIQMDVKSQCFMLNKLAVSGLWDSEQDPAEIAWDNHMQREACNQSNSIGNKSRFSFITLTGFSVRSPLTTNRRYPSISVSDLIKLMNSLSDLGTSRASQAIRRKTDPLH
ncbi:hypothetical protein PF004_g15739 [Phytophthora fragariae]|uniref:Uncharacterized protein n=1 Tax=Phytophthora fragariae TaxID=53985 RepID=A0A6G0NKE0_9STRA|nr:hypothetical protein PF004_g15739 [Phytophthora fragariae]